MRFVSQNVQILMRERERSFEISYPIIVSEILLRLQIHCIEVEINDNFCRKLSNKM